jgi:hypothetical protein
LGGSGAGKHAWNKDERDATDIESIVNGLPSALGLSQNKSSLDPNQNNVTFRNTSESKQNKISPIKE